MIRSRVMPPPVTVRYRNRTDAGRGLARLVVAALAEAGELTSAAEPVVLGLPRGGVPVAAPVAEALHATLDVLLVRKLGLPTQPELAMGAIAEVEGALEVFRNESVLRQLQVPEAIFDEVLQRETVALERRKLLYRDGRAPAQLAGRLVCVVDDGLATGSTMRAAVAAVQRRGPAGLVVAVPVGAESTCATLRAEADLVLCAWQPEHFSAVGQAYGDFSPTSDEEVRAALAMPS